MDAVDVTQYYTGAYLMLPEFILGLGAAILLLIEAFAKTENRKRPAFFTIGLLAASLVLSLINAGNSFTLFSGMVVVDPFVDFFRVFSALAGILGVIIAMDSSELGKRNVGEYYSIFLTLVMGMMLMASANDIVMIFIAIEMVSLMSYVLVGYRRHDRKGAEAALKYVIYGGAASGAMVFGFSLIYGLTGETQLPLINAQIGDFVAFARRTSVTAEAAGMPIALTAGAVLAFAGFAYKIAAVPMHMWSPDVYEGAPTPFTAFLSTGPKAAGFAVLIRFFIVGFSDMTAFENNPLGAELSGVPWLMLVIIVSMATMTLGNLAAMGQTNIKRFLAYSSIAHAGYALIGLAAFSKAGASSVLLYMAVYLVMNIGAFYVVIWVREQTGSEEIADYKGIGHRAPLIGVALTVCFVSLTGLPPMAGFIAKYKLFAAALERAFGYEPLAACAPALREGLSMAERVGCTLSGGGVFYALGVVAVVNSAISLYYYFRVVKKMFLEEPDDKTPLPTSGLAKAILVPVCAFLIFFGVLPGALEHTANTAISFHNVPAETHGITPSQVAKAKKLQGARAEDSSP